VDWLASRIGRLSLGNPQEIEWSPPVLEGDFQSPVLAISGAYSIVTFDNGNFYAPKIYCTVGEVLDLRWATCPFCALALGVYLYLPSFASADDLTDYLTASIPTLAFGPVTQFDNGVQTTVAAHRSGLFMEFHQTQAPGDYTHAF
jgi:hypothetical protein